MSRRILVVTPDRAFGDVMAGALRDSAGVVVRDSVQTISEGELEAPLCVIHCEGAIALAAKTIIARLRGDARAVVLLPRANLASAVEMMQSSQRVVGMLAVELLEMSQLAALATRLLTRDVFGLARTLRPGADIKSQVIATYDAKERCISAALELANARGVAMKHHAAIEQCLDEMLMNGLFDAVVDARGQHVFHDVTPKRRGEIGVVHPVTAELGYDGDRFAISVRDAFGSLERGRVLRVLHKCLYERQQIDRRAGGAGVGLYLMVTSASSVHFNVVPGVATEAICTFDVRAPQSALAQFGCIVEPTDVTGQLVAAPRRKVPIHRKRNLMIAGGLAAVALAGGLAAVALRDTREAAVAPPRVELDSVPTGATVEIEGKPVGGAPVTLTTLPPGARVTIVFRRVGYRDATTQLVVPAAGATARVTQKLEASAENVRVHFQTTPPGARVLRYGPGAEATSSERTYTPADVFVEAGKEHRFMLTMPGRVPLVLPPFTPAKGATALELGGELAPGTTLRIEAASGGTVSVVAAPHCQALAVPADCTLARGRYEVEHVAPGGATTRRTVDLGATETTLRF